MEHPVVEKSYFVRVTAHLHDSKNLAFYQKSLRALFKVRLQFFFYFCCGMGVK